MHVAVCTAALPRLYVALQRRLATYAVPVGSLYFLFLNSTNFNPSTGSATAVSFNLRESIHTSRSSPVGKWLVDIRVDNVSVKGAAPHGVGVWLTAPRQNACPNSVCFAICAQLVLKINKNKIVPAQRMSCSGIPGLAFVPGVSTSAMRLDSCEEEK